MLIFEITIAIYCILLVIIFGAWLIIKKPIIDLNINNELVLSLLIPVRNEEKNIIALLESIEKQSLSFENFEVIVINDQSTDNTQKLVLDYKSTSKLQLRLINSDNNKDNSAPKKHAITKAIQLAQGSIIMATDGDCVLPPKILETYLSIFQNQNINFISGPVMFFSKSILNIWQNLQIVEFSSLIGVAAASIQLNSPNMCSGANIVYRKSTFMAVNGYSDNLHLASGDDEFLMQKISTHFPNSIFYAKSKDCIVETQACGSIIDFYYQRKRWASKWKSYQSIAPSLLAIYIFWVNITLLVLTVKMHFLSLFAILALQFLFLSSVLVFLQKRKSIIYIPLMQIIYPFYVIYFALITLFSSKSYSWKGRKLK